MEKRGRRGQIQISFGMIFSIILIIVFIAVAIYAISIFLSFKKCAETGMFKENFQNTINDAWNSEQSFIMFSENLPAAIEQVCFIDLSSSKKGKYKDYYEEAERYLESEKNMFFYPLKEACEGQESFEISHIDIAKITEKDNPYCINSRGKAEIKIEKGFYDTLVSLSTSESIYVVNPAANDKTDSDSSDLNDKTNSDNSEKFCGTSGLDSCNSNSECVVGGCSSQLCEKKGKNTITTCEYRSCYNAEKYSLSCKCSSGKCRWA